MLLRKLNRGARWKFEGVPSWLPEGDAPGPPAYDFIPDKQGKLSVWELDPNKANLRRVLAAIAATRDAVDILEFVVFDSQAVYAAGATLVDVPGRSPDHDAKGKWHRDIAEVSAKRAARLACAAFCDGKRDHALPKEVSELLRAAVGEGWVEFDDLKPGVKEKLQRNIGTRGDATQVLET